MTLLHKIEGHFKKGCTEEDQGLRRVVSEWLESWTLKDKTIFIPNAR